MEPSPLSDQVTAGLEALLTVAISCAVWPPVRALAAGLTLTATEGAVPLRRMISSDWDALSLIVMYAVKEPAIAGLKLTVIVQLLPGASSIEQLLNSLKLFALILQQGLETLGFIRRN